MVDYFSVFCRTLIQYNKLSSSCRASANMRQILNFNECASEMHQPTNAELRPPCRLGYRTPHSTDCPEPTDRSRHYRQNAGRYDLPPNVLLSKAAPPENPCCKDSLEPLGSKA